MIYQPTRRDLLKYGGSTALCLRAAQAQVLPLGARNTFVLPPIALLVSASAGQNTSGAGTTAVTPLRNTTGANLIVIALSGYTPDSAPTLTDSASNSWTGLTVRSSTNTEVRLFYCSSPTTSATHTFTSTGSSGAVFTGIGMMAFSYARASSPFDQQNGATTAGATTLQPGSVTPTTDNQVIVTALASDDAGTPTINGGYTASVVLSYSATNYIGISMAYLVQTSAAATNPTWTMSGTNEASAAIATFKAP